MSEDTADEQAAAVNAFLREALKDRKGNGLGPLSEYQNRHQAHAAAIALVYAELVEGEARGLPAELSKAACPGAPPPVVPRVSQLKLGAFLEAHPGEELAQAEKYARLLEAELAGSGSPMPGPPGPGESFGPYRILGEIGRGGQGVVFHAEDTRLPRTVALKLLHSRDPGLSPAFARFRREAETASRLDHPGICTVHETGVIDGVPFIAMRRLDGETLAWRYEQVRKGAGGSPPDRPEVQRLLLLFEEAARALHAAHEAGIIHRDVKPGNIMVTSRGQPVILDFGLARDDTAGATITLTGDTLGTPAYVAPEQLEPSRGTKVDRSADVWSLGVALYEGVCGRRPFEAATRDGLYRAILTEVPLNPRRLNPAVKRDLKVVMETAIEKDRNRRYQSAAALADDLRAILDGRPIMARPVGSLGKLLRWSRREPAKAALVLALPILATLITIRVKDLPEIRAGRLAQIENENDETLSEAAYSEIDPEDALPLFQKVLDREGSSLEARAEASAGIVLAHLRLGNPDRALRTLDLHGALLGDRTSVRLLRKDALRALGRTAEAEKFEEGKPRDGDALDHYVLGMRALNAGVEVDGSDSPLYSLALRHATRAVALSSRPRLLYVTLQINAAGLVKDRNAVLDGVATVKARWPKAWSAWSHCGYGLWRLGLLEDAIAACQEALRLRPDDFRAHYYLANIPVAGRLDDAIAACQKAVLQRPGNATAHSNLGKLLREKGLHDEAIKAFRNAIRLRPNLADPRHELGSLLAAKGELDAAIEAHKEAISLQPDNAIAHFNLGNALSSKRQFDAAIEAYDKAIKVKPDYAKAHNNRGSALAKKGQLDDAILAHREAIRWKPDHSSAHYNLGHALTEKGELDDAIDCYNEAIRLKTDYAEAYVGRGWAFERKGLLDDAILAYRKAIDLKPNYSGAHNNLGKVLADQNKLDEAIAAYDSAITAEPDFAMAHYNLGNALAEKGELDDAIDCYNEAIRLKTDYAEAYVGRGWAFERKGLLDGAILAYRKAIELNPNYSLAYKNLGQAFADQGQLDEAIVTFKKATQLKLHDFETFFRLGNVFRTKGLLEDAIAAFKEAIQLNADYAGAHCNLGLALQDTGRYREALESLRRGHELGSRDRTWSFPSSDWIAAVEPLAAREELIELHLANGTSPETAAELVAFARMSLDRNQVQTAVRWFREALEKDPALFENPVAAHRFAAARAAVRASTLVAGEEAIALRDQAHRGLESELNAIDTLLERQRIREDWVQTALQAWKKEPDLAPVRDDRIEDLSEGERAGWSALWRRVQEHLLGE